MKKIFIATLLFFIALSVLASSTQAQLRELLKDQRFDLTYGVELPKQPKPFNELTAAEIASFRPIVGQGSVSIEPDGHINPYLSWYKTDFASEPFDGRIEVLVMGEPLPSATTTLFLTLTVLAILLCCRDTKWKQSDIH